MSTGIRRSRTFELLSWDYGSSRIPSLPGKSALSTGPPYAPSHRHYDRTDLVQAVTNAILPNNHRLLLSHPLPRNDYIFDGTRLKSVDTLLLSPTTSRCPSTCFTLSRSRSVLLLPDVTSLSLPLSLAHHLSLFFLFFYSVRSLERSSLYISYRTLYPPASLSPPSLGFLRRQWCSTGAETRTRG